MPGVLGRNAKATGSAFRARTCGSVMSTYQSAPSGRTTAYSENRCSRACTFGWDRGRSLPRIRLPQSTRLRGFRNPSASCKGDCDGSLPLPSHNRRAECIPPAAGDGMVLQTASSRVCSFRSERKKRMAADGVHLSGKRH